MCWPDSTIPSRAGAAATRPGLHGDHRALGGATGSAWATATSPCMSSARAGCGRRDAVADHGRCRAPPGHRPSRAADERRSRAHARAERRAAGSTFRTISCASNAARRCANWPSTALRGPAAAGLLAALGGRVRAVVICPSNPFISIEPILAVPGLRAAIAGCGAPSSRSRRSSAAGGQGTDRQDDAGARPRRERGVGRPRAMATCSTAISSIAGDAAGIRRKVHVAPTLMTTLADREALARTCWLLRTLRRER